jgi:hypothetical protein
MADPPRVHSWAWCGDETVIVKEACFPFPIRPIILLRVVFESAVIQAQLPMMIGRTIPVLPKKAIEDFA